MWRSSPSALGSRKSTAREAFEDADGDLAAAIVIWSDRRRVPAGPRGPGVPARAGRGVRHRPRRPEVPEDVEGGDTVETHLGTVFEVRELRGPDLFNHLERTGAPMMPRDVGLVMGHTGASGGDRVLDAGTGSGILAAYLGRAGADVTSYEIDPSSPRSPAGTW